MSVTGNTITIKSVREINVDNAEFSGLTFTNLSGNFPGQYVLVSSTFRDIPTQNFYSTVGNAFSLNLTGATSPKAGQLVFALSSPVPEPESYAMLLAGMGLMGVVAKRRQRQRQITT